MKMKYQEAQRYKGGGSGSDTACPMEVWVLMSPHVTCWPKTAALR